MNCKKDWAALDTAIAICQDNHFFFSLPLRLKRLVDFFSKQNLEIIPSCRAFILLSCLRSKTFEHTKSKIHGSYFSNNLVLYYFLLLIYAKSHFPVNDVHAQQEAKNGKNSAKKIVWIAPSYFVLHSRIPQIRCSFHTKILYNGQIV